MAFCTNCGAKIEDNVPFCTNCGAKQDLTPVMPAAPAPTPSPAFEKATPPQPEFTPAAPTSKAEHVQAAPPKPEFTPAAETTQFPPVNPTAQTAPIPPVQPQVQTAPIPPVRPMTQTGPIPSAQTYAPYSAPVQRYAPPPAAANAARPSGAGKLLMVLALVLVAVQLAMMLFMPLICARNNNNPAYNVMNTDYSVGFSELSGNWRNYIGLSGMGTYLSGWLGMFGFCAAIVVCSLAAIILLSLGAKAKRGKPLAIVSMVLLLVLIALYVLLYFMFVTNFGTSPMPNPLTAVPTVFSYACVGLTFVALLLCFVRLFVKDRRA